jgi:hypothetical protein
MKALGSSACLEPPLHPRVECNGGRTAVVHHGYGYGMWREATRGIASGEYSRPKTVLGFFGVLAGLFISAGVTMIVADLIHGRGINPYVTGALIFLGVLTAFVVIGVYIVMIKDPSKLMLGTITGKEYSEIQQLTQGDNVSGERIEMILPPGVDAIADLPGDSGVPSQSPDERVDRE